MLHPVPQTAQPTPAPLAFRDALAELVQIGLKVVRMVGQNADAETQLAEAAAKPAQTATPNPPTPTGIPPWPHAGTRPACARTAKASEATPAITIGNRR